MFKLFSSHLLLVVFVLTLTLGSPLSYNNEKNMELFLETMEKYMNPSMFKRNKPLISTKFNVLTKNEQKQMLRFATKCSEPKEELKQRACVAALMKFFKDF